MKKFLVMLSIIFVTGLISFFITNNFIEKQQDSKISIDLKDNGMVDGKREFIFSLENIGEDDAELQFLSWLEYNYTLDYLTDQTVSIEGTTEHIDLDEGKGEAETATLKPGDRKEYRLHLSGFPHGEYEITLSPALNNHDVGFRRLIFDME